MLTGKMAFHGETVTDTLAAVIKEEPDWSQLPEVTPVRVRVLLQRCLQKDPKQRLRDIGEARISLDEVLLGPSEPLSVFREKPTASPELMRFKIPSPEKVTLAPTGSFALSPDGRQLAFASTGSDGVWRLWIRSRDSLEPRPLSRSEMAGSPPPFFWSFDSRSIAPRGGRGPQTSLCDLRDNMCGPMEH